MKVLALVLLSIVLILDVKALSVASDYLERSTLELVEGTSTIYSIRLQNPDTVQSRVRVEYDGEFMKAIDFKEVYTLPPESSTRIEFEITAPEYEKNKDIFHASFTVTQLQAEGEAIPLITKINKNFKIKVLINPDRFYIDPLYFVYTAGALIFFIFISRKEIMNLFRKRNKTPGNEFKSRKIIKWKD